MTEAVVSTVKGVFFNSNARIPHVHQHLKGKYTVQSKREKNPTIIMEKSTAWLLSTYKHKQQRDKENISYLTDQCIAQTESSSFS